VQTDINSKTITSRRICRIAWLAFSLYLCIPVYAIDPKVAAGLKVGVPYEFIDIHGFSTDHPSGSTKISQQNYIKPSISASVELSLPWNLAVEMSASYKEMRYHRTAEVTVVGGAIPFYTVTHTTYDSDSHGHAWEFPLIIRKYLMPIEGLMFLSRVASLHAGATVWAIDPLAVPPHQPVRSFR